MFPFQWVLSPRVLAASLVLGLAIPGSVRAEPHSAALLPLDEALRLAIRDQPLLAAQQSAVAAARESAIGAGELPDPKLTGGLMEWPVNGPDRYSIRRDDFTELQIGLSQEFTRASKRRLRGERGAQAARTASADLDALQLTVRRDVALTWLTVWVQAQAVTLATAALNTAELQVGVVNIASRTGSATRADVLSAQGVRDLLRDQIADQEHQLAEARIALSRWIGADAERPLPAGLPDPGPPADLPTLLDRGSEHPLLRSAASQTEVARSDVQLARAGYKPDWTVGVVYAYRLDFPDYVGVNFAVDLPFFTANRQDRGLAAGLQEQRRAENLSEDLGLQQAVQIRQSLSGWQHFEQRLVRYEREILPRSAERSEAARLAWQSGQGNLAAVLDARQAELERRMQHLALRRQAAAARVTLDYLTGPQPTGEQP